VPTAFQNKLFSAGSNEDLGQPLRQSNKHRVSLSSGGEGGKIKNMIPKGGPERRHSKESAKSNNQVRRQSTEDMNEDFDDMDTDERLNFPANPSQSKFENKELDKELQNFPDPLHYCIGFYIDTPEAHTPKKTNLSILQSALRVEMPNVRSQEELK
jgi:hypothetical protein